MDDHHCDDNDDEEDNPILERGRTDGGLRCLLKLIQITCGLFFFQAAGHHEDDDDGDDDGDEGSVRSVGDDGNVIDDDDELSGLCGAQSGAGEKKILDATLRKGNSKSDVTLTKTSNGSKVSCQ